MLKKVPDLITFRAYGVFENLTEILFPIFLSIKSLLRQHFFQKFGFNSISEIFELADILIFLV